jgi:hypothetical protein
MCLAVDGRWSLMQVTPAFFAVTYTLYTTTFNFCHFYTHILIHYAASFACSTDVSKYAVFKSFAGTFLLFFYFCLLIVIFPVAILLFFAVISCCVAICTVAVPYLARKQTSFFLTILLSTFQLMLLLFGT